MGKREETALAWKVDVKAVQANGYNLDIKNPSAQQDYEHMAPELLLDDILAKEHRILELLGELKGVIKGEKPALREPEPASVPKNLN